MLHGSGAAATFSFPLGVVCDSVGNVYVIDSGNSAIRKVTPAGVVTTFVGASQGYSDGIASSAAFLLPRAIAMDGAGNLYVADTGNTAVRKVATSGAVSTLAGYPQYGSSDGTAPLAKFNGPQGVATGPDGNIYVADFWNSSVRKVTPSGTVSTITNVSPYSTGIAVDNAGNIYVSSNYDSIYKVSAGGAVSLFAGGGVGSPSGFVDGAGATARFSSPKGLAVDGVGNVYVADKNNHAIRKISPSGVVSTLAGDGTAGLVNGAGSAARFSDPFGVAVDKSGNVFVADFGNSAIRGITPAGNVTTFVGGPGGFINAAGMQDYFRIPVELRSTATGCCM